MVQCELAKGPTGLSMPLFTRLRSVGVHVRMLDIQYRMHPAIALFPSTEFYDGNLGMASLHRTERLRRDLTGLAIRNQ